MANPSHLSHYRGDPFSWAFLMLTAVFLITSILYAFLDHYTELFSLDNEGFSGSYTKSDGALFQAVFTYAALLASGLSFGIYYHFFRAPFCLSSSFNGTNTLYGPLDVIKSREAYISAYVLSLIFFAAISILCLDGITSRLWHYYGYLNRTHYSSLNFSLFISNVTYVSLFPLGALLSVGSLLIGLVNRSIGLISLSSACNIFILIISFSAASRATSLHLLLIAGVLFVQRSRMCVLFSICFTFLCLICYAGALASRDGASFGISMVPQFFITGIYSLDIGLSSIIFDPIIGVRTTAASIQTAGSTGYSTEYSILSFSPLPSFIDGFDQIKNANEKRIHEYIPFSSIAEAWLFGGPYFIAYTAIWGLWVLQLSILCQIFKLIGLIYSLSIFVVIASSSGQYPMRNTFRYLLATIIISIAIERYAARHQRLRSVAN